MSDIHKTTSILFVGTGNMAMPQLRHLLTHQPPLAEKITIAAGSSAGKDKAAVEKLIANIGTPTIASITVLEKNDPAIATLPEHDTFFFGAKPADFNSIADTYCHAIATNALGISIAGSVTLAQIESAFPNKNLRPVRVIPHLPLAVYGICGAPKSRNAANELLGYGTPRIVVEGDTLHNFMAHFSCGPAFIALHLAKNPSPQDTLTFKEAWTRLLEQDFGKGTQWLDTLWDATVAKINETGISPEDFANSVRSKGGITNAGMLFLGSPPPAEGFGNDAERAEQMKLVELSNEITPAQSILYALLAAKQRSRAMATQPEVLGGIDVEAIKRDALNVFNQGRARG